MCGIFGVTIGNKPAEVKQAIESFKYRGPDDTGVFSDEQVTLANVRLSIIDPNSRSNQPMFDRNREVCVVFNGEIFNHKQVRTQLSEYNFKTESDTETIIYAYKKFGLKCFEKFYGMFAICIYDLNKNELILARDFAGIKPLLYHIDQNQNLAFSSEMKGVTTFSSLTNSSKMKFELDQDTIHQILHLGYALSPNTIYSNVKKLEKSSILVFDLETKKYSTSKFEPVTPSNLKDISLDTVLNDSVLRHLESDVPVGLFFSGGIDSTVIANYLHKNKIKLHTYSILLEHKQDDEKYSKLISEHMGLDSKFYKFGIQEFDEIYHEVLNRFHEPNFDTTVFPTYFLSKIAQKEVKVVISGSGGDEYFMGYPRHFVLSQLHQYKDYNLNFLDYLYLLTPKFYAKRAMFAKIFTYFKKPFSYYLLSTSLNSSVKSWRTFKNFAKNKNLEARNIDRETYLESDLLQHLDVATSFASVEGRVPFIDPVVSAKAITLLDTSTKNDEGKYELKKLLERYIPKDFIYRKKSGFGLPISTMLLGSKYFKQDLETSIKYLQETAKIKSELIQLPKNYEADLNKNPFFYFLLVSLYYSIKNTQN